MRRMGKKKKAKKTESVAPANELAAELSRLRKENEVLRALLEQIAELATDLPPQLTQFDEDEDDEYDELTRDVDDQIADEQAARVTEPSNEGPP